MAETIDPPMDGPPTQLDTPLEHFELGSLEKVDPMTGTVTIIFSRCLLTHCRVGERMSVKSDDEGNIHTSNVVERRAKAGGYEVLTKSGTVYRFTRTESGQEKSISLIGNLRQKVMRLLPFWKKKP